MAHVTTLVVALKTASLLLGAAVTYFAFRAYRRTRHPALRALAVGFAVVTVGALLAGVVDQLLPLDRNYALVVDSGLTAVGFAIIVYSLFVE